MDFDARAAALSEAKRFKLIRASDLQVHPASWIVRDFLERDALGLVFGDPGTSKSFLAVGLSACVASGLEWMGHRVEQCPVVYIAGEGHNGLSRRLRAWGVRHGVDLADVPLFVSSTSAALTDPSVLDDVQLAINGVSSSYGQPGLLVIDTIARNFGPGDENSTQDMGRFIQACDLIREKYRCTVLLIHHTGHADKSRARGAMALKGAVDAEYRLDRDETGVIRLECTKMKDALPPEPMAFRLATVELGLFDDDGEPVTSAVLESTSYAPPPAKGKAGRGKWQTVARETLDDLHATHRENKIKGGYDPDTARVTVDHWRDECLKRGMPKQRFYDAKESLLERGEIHIEHGFVR